MKGLGWEVGNQEEIGFITCSKMWSLEDEESGFDSVDQREWRILFGVSARKAIILIYTTLGIGGNSGRKPK